MIPNLNGNTIVPPSPRKHVHNALPIEKIDLHSSFLLLKSTPVTIMPPFDLQEEAEEKPFIRVVNKDTDSEKDTVIHLERPRLMIRKDSLVEKREIVIPNNKNLPKEHTRVESIDERPHKKLHTDLHYIKVDHMQSLPTADVYEPTDNDLKFLFELNQKIFNGCENSSNASQITDSQFESLILAWEHETAFEDIIFLERALQVAEGSCLKNKILMDQNNLIRTEALTEIYNYWKGLREQFQRPLVRKYLKGAHKDYTNPNIAFIRRKENKFARRRSQRTSSPIDDFKRMKNLRKNLERSYLLLSNCKYREMLKLESHEIKEKIFEEQVKAQLGEDYNLLEAMYPKTESITKSNKYKEDRKKVEEYSKKGEIIVKTINSVRKDSFKSDIGFEPKRKLSTVQASTSSTASTTSTATTSTPTNTSHRPMSLGLSKLTNTLPRTIQGSFTLPRKKSSIDLRELKVKLTKSLGSLFLKTHEDNRVKVELKAHNNNKMEEECGDKENQSGNIQKKMVKESHEELLIKIELQEHIEKDETGKLIPKTTVRYSVIFDSNSQPFNLQNAKSQSQPSGTSQPQFLPHNAKEAKVKS